MTEIKQNLNQKNIEFELLKEIDFNSLPRYDYDDRLKKLIYLAGYDLILRIVAIVDENVFEIEFFDRKKEMGWGTLRDIFFSGLRLNENLNLERTYNLLNLLEIPKQEFFDYCKKYRVIQGLKSKDETD